MVKSTTVVSLQGALFAPQQRQLCFDFSVMSVQVLKETDSLSERRGKRRDEGVETARGARGEGRAAERKTKGTKTHQKPGNPVYRIIIQRINEVVSRCGCSYLDASPVCGGTYSCSFIKLETQQIEL